MPERRNFEVVRAAPNQDPETLNLELGEQMDIPFTGGVIIFAITEQGEGAVIKKTLRNEQAKHEWIGLTVAHSTGILTPRPIALINYTADQLAIVSSLVEGDNLYYCPNPAKKPEIGRQIKVMHQNAQTTGESWRSTGRDDFTYYDRYIFDWKNGGFEELKADTQTAVVLAQHAAAMEQLCMQSRPVFNHNDLHDGQVIIDSTGAPVIIDFGNWNEETPLNDLGYHLFHLVRTDRATTDDFPNFLTGYTEGRGLSEQEKENLAFYLLFISSRALTYFYRSHSSYLSVARETHSKVLDHLDKEEIWKRY